MLTKLYEYFFGSSTESFTTSLYKSYKSSVYRVLDETRNTDYTVKYCIVDGIEYTNEVKILKALRDCSGVQQYINHFESWGRMQLIYNYIEGDDLFTVLTETVTVIKPLADLYFRELLNIMKTVHNIGIVHRDLKPENIIIHKNQLKLTIIDWGLACFYTPDKASLNHSCGSIYYSAPEIITKTMYIGPEVDVWSLGVIWYILHSGKFPYDTSTVTVSEANERKNERSEFLSRTITENYIQSFIEIAEKIKLMSPDYSQVDEYVANILKLIFTNRERRIGINKILLLLRKTSFYCEAMKPDEHKGRSPCAN